MEDIKSIWEKNKSVYGARKIWHQMKREGKTIARCTVERLMRKIGIQGIRRGKKIKAAHPYGQANCPLDLVNRQFTADKPNKLWVADFTYISTWQGWLYIAFVFDTFKNCIFVWLASIYMNAYFFIGSLYMYFFDI